MGKTVVGVNSPQAVKRFSNALTLDVSQESFFGSRFTAMGTEAQVPIQHLTDLEAEQGDQIQFDLLTELRMAPVEGDNILEGKEEGQKFYTDEILVDQMRQGVNTGGRMTRKRTLHDLRMRAKGQAADWWRRVQDELQMMYLAGSRGVNPNFVFPLSWNGRAGNPLAAPGQHQHMFGGDATAVANITADDKMTLGVVERCLTRAQTQGGGATNIPVLKPCKMGGEECYVMVMHTWQEDDMRKDTSTGGWLDIQKSLATALGNKSPLCRNALGVHRGVVMHSHRNVIRHSNHGATANVQTARALFMGSQAGVVAFGSPGTGMRYDWHEETRDNGNQVVITTSSIFGTKRTQYEIGGVMHDLGMYSVDTAAAAR